MKKIKLTTAGRCVVFVILLALLGTGGYFGYGALKDNGIIGGEKDPKPGVSDSQTTPTNPGSTTKPSTPGNNGNDDMTINLSIDEWVGYRTIVQANGGLTTQPGSIFDKHGLTVNLSLINDPTESSNALISGDIDGAGYTLNRVAFLSDKFSSAGLDIVFPLFTNYSCGGDGIVAKDGINNVTDLVGKKIGVPRFGESHAMVIWFVNNSDLSAKEKQSIIDNLILFESASDTGEAFFAGQLDVAATWQPYLSFAAEGDGTHIMFSTKDSKTLVMSGVIFRKDFAESHAAAVTAFMDSIFEANDTESNGYDYLREVMPMFADSSDADIEAQFGDAEMLDFADNKVALETNAPKMYATMCGIWESIGEKVDRKAALTMFDTSYLMGLSDKYSSTVVDDGNKVTLTEDQKQEVIDYDSLLTKSATIEFLGDAAVFKYPEQAYEVMDEFVEIADILSGSIIQIEGNINATNYSEAGMKLSENRAQAVADYLVMCGIDPDRIIVVGNGNTKMVAEVGSADEYLNRRTDVFFKVIEG